MKKYLIPVFLALTLHSNAQNWLWAKNAIHDGKYGANGNCIISDINGNIYVAGTFGCSSIQFGNTPPLIHNLLYPYNDDLFIVKYDSTGKAIWSKGITSGLPYGISTDKFCNIYIIGFFIDSIKFGSTPVLYCNGINDIFLTKYDSSGNALWSRSAGGSADDYGTSVATDSNGNVYITGYFRSDTIQFGNTPSLHLIHSYGVSNFGFIAKYDSSGNAIWAINPKGQCYPNSIIVDKNSNLYFAGIFGDSIIFSRNPLITVISNNNLHTGDVYISKYDSSGNAIWAESACGEQNDGITSITADANSNVYAIGYFYSDSIQFGNTPVLFNSLSVKYPKIFIAKYDSSGNSIWAKGVDPGNNYPKGIAIDANSNIFATGYFRSDSIQFGNTPALANNWPLHPQYLISDIFLAIYNTSGNAQSAVSVGGIHDDDANCITIDHSGNVYISGDFHSSSIQFGSTPPLINSSSGTHYSYFFIAKYKGISTSIGNITFKDNISIFPNPSSNIFTVKIPHFSRYVEVFNSLGQILEMRNVKNEKEISFEIKDNGIYFLQIVTNKETITKKVVIYR